LIQPFLLESAADEVSRLEREQATELSITVRKPPRRAKMN
jgi:hypothetical protein